MLFYNCRNAHLEGSLMFGEVVEAVGWAEDDHLHPQALHGGLSFSSSKFIEENGQRKDTDIGEEVETE